MKAVNKAFLFPSSIFASRMPCQVDTILGSCLSVCLWDSKLKFGGMNHFMLPLWNGQELASPKYGNIAIEKLITKMTELGSERKSLQAKIFGGAEQLESSNTGRFKIGATNIKVAIDLLRIEKIPIVNFSIGGNRGRKVHFFSQTGEVLMKYVGIENPAKENFN